MDPENDFCTSLATHSEQEWSQALHRLLPDIHAVDRRATLIWFAFWPIKLRKVLEETGNDPQKLRYQFEMAGAYSLRDQLGSTLVFLHGARHWSHVQRAVLESGAGAGPSALEELIRAVGDRAAAGAQVPASEVLGISAVALMALRLVGREAFAQTGVAAGPASRLSADARLAARRRSPGRGWLSFLKTVQTYPVVWDESRPGAVFEAAHGQDLSMASATDNRDYREEDPRRVEGPIPLQCRSGACGSCWVGVLSGEEQLSEPSEFETRRLQHFGYAFPAWAESPIIRLACQTVCHGPVSLVIPPWNGVLHGRE